jgi:predicted  nucleic acid-binding Zn-ribbon protein
MSKEPDNLVLKLLREMRVILDEHSLAHLDTKAELRELKKQIYDWQETTATAVGLATHSNLRNQAIENQIADMAKRIDRLERAK